MPSRESQSWCHGTVALVVVLLLCMVVCGADAVNDHAQLHSFFPPILQHYWQNGFLFWSFGKQTVVTDSYVRLTENEAGSTGYLWNRHENDMGSFEFNVTARMLDRDGSWFSSGNAKNGLGIWYTVKSANPLADTSFYGFERSFDGFGVVLDHSNTITLYVGEGGAAGQSVPRAVATCSVSSLKENFITISTTYDDAQRVTVFYTKHNNADMMAADALESTNYVACLTANVNAFDSNAGRHFGVTASNAESEQTVHDIHSVFMTPLSDVDAHEVEEQRVRNVHLFDGEKSSAGRPTLNTQDEEAEEGEESEDVPETTSRPKPTKKKGKKRVKK